MTQARTRFASRSRGFAVAEVDARRAWLQLIGLLREHARRAVAGEPVDAFEAGGLAREVERMKAPFPLDHASAAAMAAATLAAARGFVAAGRPEDKAAIARVLADAVAFLERQLVDQGHALAATSRRRAGDTD